MATLLYLGHGSLRFTTAAGHVVYVDPYMSPKGADASDGYDLPADLVLVTHQHGDHTAVDKMPHAPGCELWDNFGSHPALDAYLQRTFCDGDVAVQAVQAYNSHHAKDACVGYLLRMDGLTIYCAGDTGPTAQMAELADEAIDYAFLPGDGIYTMTPEQAAACATQLRARHAVPIHLKPVQPYGEAEAAAFAAACACALLIRPGEPHEL